MGRIVNVLKTHPAAKGSLKRADRYGRRVMARAQRNEPRYSCSVCGYTGVFLQGRYTAGQRRWAECGNCGALERHRLQAEILSTRVFPLLDPQHARCLQLAPDPLTPWIKDRLANVLTGDLADAAADLRLDARKLDLPNESFDYVHASHVLEHVDDDGAAIAEIWRVLAPGGIAMLAVPILAPKTVEYGAPNPHEEDHVRAPGLDYFERYRSVFSSVEVVTSADVRQEIQPWIHQDRTHFPTPNAPLRPPMDGDRHVEAVPICRK